MNLVATAYNLTQLNKLNDLASHVLLPVGGLTSSDGIDLDKAIGICNSKKIIPILRMDAMLHEDMLLDFEKAVLKYKDTNCLYYITDLGAANIIIKNSLVSRVIFDPQTLICNYLDAAIYQNMGFEAISMSLEVTIKDVIKACNMADLRLFYQVFGHRLMFHSKRKLVKLYETKCNINIKRDNMYLIEEKREDKYPIIETPLGTYIYRSYQISLINELNNLDLKYAYLESRFLDYDIYLKVLSLYKEYINKNTTLEDVNNNLASLCLNIEDGFTFKDSVYQKEEF